MFVSGRNTFGRNLRHLSLNQFLFLITIFQVHEVLAENDLLGTTTTNEITTINGTTCAERWTCSSCTEPTTPECKWFVFEQMCADNTAVAVQSRLEVTNGSFCPKFSVNNSMSGVAGNNILTVTVNDEDMGGGFIGLLANSRVKCQLGNNSYMAKMDGNRISCHSESTLKPQYNVKCLQLDPYISHLSIVFDDKLLRFDNVSDHYVTTYPLPDNCPKAECQHCHWSNATHMSYCKWCLGNSTKPVDRISYQYCEVRNISSFVRLSATNTRDDERCFGKGPVVVKDSVTPKMMLQSDQLDSGFVSQAGNNSSPVNPTVDDGQLFGGIVSGGTTYRVRGRRFCSLQEVKACVSSRHWCGHCDVHNDTLMVCHSPKIDFKPLPADKPLVFYVKNSTHKEFAKLVLPSMDYRVYQDPYFTDFVVDGCCNVTVNGLYLDKGYAAEDLSIVLIAENSSSRCLVTSMDSTRIICELSSSIQLGPPPKQINVTIGDSMSVVNLAKQNSSSYKRSLAVIILPGIVTIGAYVSFIAVLCVALVFFKSSEDYDLLHIHDRQRLVEIRPLEERNPNDYDDNNESEKMLSVRDERHI